MPAPSQTLICVHVTCGHLAATAWLEPAGFELPAGELAVYRLPHAAGPALAARCATLLSADERVRAGRYHHAADQQRFTVVRAALRELLGRYTGQPPARIAFELGPHKKPRVQGQPALHFSVSHTAGWALIAFARQEIGIDIEAVNEQFAFTELLAYSFSAAEQAAIVGSADSRYQFYQAWTRKEALVKATAQGIDDEFALVPSQDGLHRLPAGRFGAGSWQVDSFAPVPGYVAALAYPSRPGGWQPRFLALPAGWLAGGLAAG